MIWVCGAVTQSPFLPVRFDYSRSTFEVAEAWRWSAFRWAPGFVQLRQDVAKEPGNRADLLRYAIVEI